MSFSRNAYDECAILESTQEAMGPGLYKVNEPKIFCPGDGCYPYAPSVRLQKIGGSICADKPLVDVDSELKRLNYILSDDDNKGYQPCSKYCDLYNFKDCYQPQENTRMDNPPSNMRGTGINRWEWLCQNPQDKVSFDVGNGRLPFQSHVDTNILFRDNHRPCLPHPIDPELSLPHENTQMGSCGIRNYQPVQFKSNCPKA